MELQQDNTNDNCDILTEIRDIESKRLHMINLQKQGIVKEVDVVIQELTKREFKLKERKVLLVHEYAISEVTIKKHGKPVKCYQTRLGGKRPRYNNYEDLIEIHSI